MSVTTEASGKRSVTVTVEVPGTPDDVWQAIGTGPGVSSWFVPTSFEEADGKPVAVTMRFGPGMEVRSPVIAWDPPRSFTAQGQGWGGSPPIATEWNVEPLAADRCRIRVVNSFVAATPDWDSQLEATEAGWPGFFRTLTLYLTHFRGQPSALLQLMAPVPGSEAQAWAALGAATGLHSLQPGRPWSTPPGVPKLGGVAEYLSDNPYDALVRLEVPGPGVAAFGVFSYGGQCMAAISVYYYGEDAQGALARERPVWEAWMQDRFPATPEQASP